MSFRNSANTFLDSISIAKIQEFKNTGNIKALADVLQNTILKGDNDRIHQQEELNNLKEEIKEEFRKLQQKPSEEELQEQRIQQELDAAMKLAAAEVRSRNKMNGIHTRDSDEGIDIFLNSF